MAQQTASKTRGRLWLCLLFLPWLAVLWVPFYNRVEPRVFGFPFFYWYQLAWVLISALLTAWVYFKTRGTHGVQPPEGENR